MIKSSRQLRDLVRNLSEGKKADAQILMSNYMMERFLERVSLCNLLHPGVSAYLVKESENGRIFGI